VKLRIVALENVKMKNAILEKGKWRKLGKPKVVSVAPPPAAAAPAAQVQYSETTAAPKAIRITEPEQGVGMGPGRKVTLPQKPVVPAPAAQPEPMNVSEKERNDEVKQMQTDTVVKGRTTGEEHYSNTPGAVVEETAAEEKASKMKQSTRTEKLRGEPARRRGRDLQGGMELLGLDFLLSIVENTDSSAELDVTMRKLNFNELIRTEQLHAVDSNVLRVYAMNSDGLYDKNIQCEAIKELTARTASNDPAR
jgi:hypothetical protein